MFYTRDLEVGCESGADILFMKQRLNKLGLYEGAMKTETKTVFDEDMDLAVLNFQCRNDLPITGVIDQDIWNAILGECDLLNSAQPSIFDTSDGIPQGESVGASFTMPRHISPEKAEAIAKSFSGVSNSRRNLVFLALEQAYDHAMPSYYPRSLYIPGRTLYDKHNQTDLLVVDEVLVKDISVLYAFSPKQITHYLEAIALRKNTTGADDSGGIIGLCHKLQLCKPGTDPVASVMASDAYSTPISKEELRPGDWVYKDIKIGLYVGGGYVVQWAGPSYGCQLTDIPTDDRGTYTLHNFIRNKDGERKAWTKYRRPKWY